MHDACDGLQVAEVMAKVAEQVRDAEEEAERRAPILDMLQEIASMRAECAWLASYEKDSARFKVCSMLRAAGMQHIACRQRTCPERLNASVRDCQCWHCRP